MHNAQTWNTDMNAHIDPTSALLLPNPHNSRALVATCLTRSSQKLSTAMHATSINMFPHSNKINRIGVSGHKRLKLYQSLKILGLWAADIRWTGINERHDWSFCLQLCPVSHLAHITYTDEKLSDEHEQTQCTAIKKKKKRKRKGHSVSQPGRTNRSLFDHDFRFFVAALLGALGTL